jgi:hypothetical protein
MIECPYCQHQIHTDVSICPSCKNAIHVTQPENDQAYETEFFSKPSIIEVYDPDVLNGHKTGQLGTVMDILFGG